jgi:hypothetical protein
MSRIRDGGSPEATLPGGSTYTLTISGASVGGPATGTGVIDLPASGITAVALVLTEIPPTDPGETGYLTAYPDGTSRPGISEMTFDDDQQSNTMLVPVGAKCCRHALLVCGSMSAQPAHEPDPDDPVEIVRTLPARFHDQFLREYYGAAAGAARQVGGYRQLHDVLRMWRLTAAAQSDPGFAGRLAAIREAVRTGSLEGSVPIQDAIPGWPPRS